MAWDRNQMAARAAQELEDGFYVNLGIGIPTLVANHIPEGMNVTLQSENGMLGMGPFPYEGEMIRGGHIDLSILGAMEVAENGDIANWMIPGKMVKGMGGAMDLVAGVKRCIALFDHTNKRGESKFIKACTLPLTGKGCIHMVITDLGVFDRTHGAERFKLIELAPGVTLDEVKSKTPLKVSKC